MGAPDSMNTAFALARRREKGRGGRTGAEEVRRGVELVQPNRDCSGAVPDKRDLRFGSALRSFARAQDEPW